MKIEAIRIKNFKTLRDISITELPSFAVFVGANGTGKTTLWNEGPGLSRFENAILKEAL